MSKLSDFQSIMPGDKVTFLIPNGPKLVNGKAVPEFKAASGKAMPMLCQPITQGTVVVNMGGVFGKPGVVTIKNFISVKKPAAKGKPVKYGYDTMVMA